jgi:hypothetical protein
VRALSSQPALTVLGDAGDAVVLIASDIETDTEPGFQLFSKGPVALRVADGVTVTIP